MATVHRNSVKPVMINDWNTAARQRQERIEKRLAVHKNIDSRKDNDALQARKSRIEELAKYLKSPTRNKNIRQNVKPVNSAKIKLEPLSSRKAPPPNSENKRKNSNASLKRPKSAQYGRNTPTKQDEKYERELIAKWKKDREMATDTRSMRSLTLSNHEDDEDSYGNEDEKEEVDNRKKEDDDDEEEEEEEEEDDDDNNEDDDDEDDEDDDDEKAKPVKKPNGSKPGKKNDRSAKKAEHGGTDDKGHSSYETNEDHDKVSLKIVKEIIQQMKGLTEEERLMGVYRARKQLSIETNPPTQLYIDEGAITPLVTCLASINPNLQFEAAWALTNISSGHSQQAVEVYEGGAVPQLIYLLSSPYNRVSDQCVWALGNMAGDGPYLWHAVVDKGVVKPLYALIERSPSLSSLRNLSWTFSNILRHKPLTLSDSDFALCVKAIRLFLHHPDKEIQLNASWSLVYITDNEPDKIADVIKAGILPRLIEDLLDSSDTKTVTPAIRAIGNIMTGNDSQTEKVVSSGVVPVLVKHLYNPSTAIRKDAAWALSNITAGTNAQIQEVLDAKALPPLAAIMNKDEPKIKKEAAWCVSNMTEAGTKEQLNEIVGSNLVQSLTRTIVQNKDDEALLVVAFEGLKNMIEKCNDHDRVSRQILAEMTLKEIKDFGSHSNEHIKNSTSTIYTIASKGRK